MIVGYVRVSDKEKQEHTRQQDAIEKAFPGQIEAWYIDSGSRDNVERRAEYLRLMDDVRAGKISSIRVVSQDRWGQPHHVAFAMSIKELLDHNVTLIDINGNELASLSEVSQLMTVVGSLTSTREIKEKSKRATTTGAAYAQGKGTNGIPRAMGGIPAYGLDLLCLDEDGNHKWILRYESRTERTQIFPDGRRERLTKGGTPGRAPGEFLTYTPNPERAPTLIRIFQLYTQGQSPAKIARTLNAEGVSAVVGSWDKCRIINLLSNPACIGKPAYAKRSNSKHYQHTNNGLVAVPPNAKMGRRAPKSDWVMPAEPLYELVPLNLWEKAQERRNTVRPGQRKPAATAHLFLKGIVYCWHCKREMRAFNRSKRQGYACSTYSIHGRPDGDSPQGNTTGCRLHFVSHEDLVKIVSEHLHKTKQTLDLLPNEKPEFPHEAHRRATDLWFDIMVEEEREERPYHEIVADRLGPLQKQLEELETALDGAVANFMSLAPGSPSHSKAKEYVEKIEHDLESTRQQLEALDKPAQLEEALEALRVAREQYNNALKVWKEGTYQQRSEALKQIIERIEVKFEHHGMRGSEPSHYSLIPAESPTMPSAYRGC